MEYSLDSKDSSMQAAFVKNICFKGVCLVINQEIKAGTIMFLNIYLLGDKQPMSVKAQVVWQRFISNFGLNKIKHYALGVEFLDLSQDKREKLIKLLQTP